MREHLRLGERHDYSQIAAKLFFHPKLLGRERLAKISDAICEGDVALLTAAKRVVGQNPPRRATARFLTSSNIFRNLRSLAPQGS